MATVLETRLRQAQAEPMAPIDLMSCLVSDELNRRSERLLDRRRKQAAFRDPHLLRPLRLRPAHGTNAVMGLPSWLKTPEMLVTFILFGVSVVVSVFATDLRRFLAFPLQKRRERRIAATANRLRLLLRLHKNTYRLLLYLLWDLAESSVYLGISGMAFVLG